MDMDVFSSCSLKKLRGFYYDYFWAMQALRKEPLTVYGDGKQTRSFQYVSDLVRTFSLNFFMSIIICPFSSDIVAMKFKLNLHVSVFTRRCCSWFTFGSKT